MAASAEAACQRGIEVAGGDGAILQRRGIVVELDQRREGRADRRNEQANRDGALGHEVDADTAGDDGVHHQPVAERGRSGAQHPLAQHRAMGVHQREGGVVANRADVAEVVGETLELGHQRA
jgi:hypothetical protein